MPLTPDSFWGMVCVLRADQCWTWTGGRTRTGYGSVWTDGKHKRAHRVAWELAHGEILQRWPKNGNGLCVLHTCDNPLCMNPNHLFLGSKGDNNRDRDQKGRGTTVPARMIRRLRQLSQAHCKRGHPLSGDNLYIPPGRPRRVCRECQRERHRAQA